MKTSVIEVHEMLSVWSVDDVEKRIGDVPGVESVTVNFAARSATVRYDETRLAVADIKTVVRQGTFESEASGGVSDSPTPTPAPSAVDTAGSAGHGEEQHAAAPDIVPPATAVAAPTPVDTGDASPAAPTANDHEGHSPQPTTPGTDEQEQEGA